MGAGPGPAGPGWPGPAPGHGQHGPPPRWPASPTDPFVVRAALQILAPILLVAGLSIPEGGSVGWTSHLLWAIFAVLAALGQLLTLGGPGPTAERRWRLAAVAVGALVGYWVIIVLPGIASNAGFLQTLAVGCAAGGLWLAPGRRP